MKTPRQQMFFSLFLLAFLFVPINPAHALSKVLSVPGFPFFLVMDLRDGNEVRKLVLRTPGETKVLDSFQGLIYTSQIPLLSYTDRDWHKDLLWQVRFSSRQNSDGHSMGRDLWIGALTAPDRMWVGSTETRPSLWDSLIRSVEVPAGTGFIISPEPPAHSPEFLFQPENDLTFVYTFRLTKDGPRFVIVPSIYKDLAAIAGMIRDAEQDPALRSFYESLVTDFTTMSQGNLPSVVALARFPWKNMGHWQIRQ